MADRLHVFLGGRHVGVVTRGTLATVAFQFDRDVPLDLTLSWSMPTRPGGRYSADRASAFFNGLLPDGADARLRMAQAFDSLDTSTYSLLAKGGLDCAGAVQVWNEHVLPDRSGALIPLTESQVASRLRAAMAGPGEDLRAEDEHWSLSGAQRKIALRLSGETWHLPTGTEPSSHILKPGVTTIPGVAPADQALAEHVTMTAARRLGVDVAATAYAEFDGTGAVVVERFDRAAHGDQLARVHQEDMCQALGVDATGKYESDGGPGVTAIARLLRAAIADPRDADVAVRRFARMVAFNYLAEGSDAHAKNFGLLHPSHDDVDLAPMYDAATGAFASLEGGARRFPRGAMRIGRQRHFGAATLDDWQGLLRDLGLPAEDNLLADCAAMARDLPDAFATALDHAGAPADVRERLHATPMLSRLRESAEHAVAVLPRPEV